MTATFTAPPIEQVAPTIQTRVKEGDLKGAQNLMLGLGAAMLIGSCAVGMTSSTEHSRFAFSYLTAFMFTLGIQLGALVFTLIQHITRAGWSVAMRRVAENVMATLPWMLLLFVPIFYGFKDLFPWHEIDPADKVLKGKEVWLNPTFFAVRVGIYFAIWIGLAWYYRSASLRQDETGDPAITLRLSRVAAPGILLFALSITFAAFDWIMSLNPHWFSTIFGITYFAGALMAFLAFVTVACKYLGKKGYLHGAVTTEHYHDIGKLMFGFMVFWTYTNFSQYMLIWYANLPEETRFFAVRRAGNGWGAVGTLLIFGHFLVPFAFLMSRHMKRNTVTLVIGSLFLLVMHWIDMQYLILPNFAAHDSAASGGEAAHHAAETGSATALFDHFGHDLPLWLGNLKWFDFTNLLGMVALLCGLTLFYTRKSNLLPTRDPRLVESLSFHNF